MCQIQSLWQNNCVLLAVLCGKHAEKRSAVVSSTPKDKGEEVVVVIPILGAHLS
jgi:hypothetical protein